jgi:hypothetical protein
MSDPVAEEVTDCPSEEKIADDVVVSIVKV